MSPPQQTIPSPSLQIVSRHTLPKATPRADEGGGDKERPQWASTRRLALAAGGVLASSGVLGLLSGEAEGVVKQGLLAGRIPGLSEPDEEG